MNEISLNIDQPLIHYEQGDNETAKCLPKHPPEGYFQYVMLVDKSSAISKNYYFNYVGKYS